MSALSYTIYPQYLIAAPASFEYEEDKLYLIRLFPGNTLIQIKHRLHGGIIWRNAIK